VKETCRSTFYYEDWSTKFHFNWTDNPQRYEMMKKEELFVDDK